MASLSESGSHSCITDSMTTGGGGGGGGGSYNHNLAYLKPLDICKFNWLIHVTKTNTVDKRTNRMKMWM